MTFTLDPTEPRASGHAIPPWSPWTRSCRNIDGFEVVRQLRLFSDAYIFMLTARTEELDTLMGPESGADDYVIKPFHPRARISRHAAPLGRGVSPGGLGVGH